MYGSIVWLVYYSEMHAIKSCVPNGTQRVFTYDSASRVASVRDEVASGGALVSQFALGYEAEPKTSGLDS